MAQSLTLKCSGLYTHPNDLSAVPDGALAVADNIVINREGIAEPRRGFDLFRHGSTASVFSDGSYRANKLFFYKDKVLCHYDTSLLAYHDDATGWTNVSGTYSAPSATVKIRGAQANQNFYFTTSAGVKKMDSYNSTPRSSGVPRGLDTQASLSGSSGFLLAGYRVAYRIVWGYRDANNNLILSAPSQVEDIKNTSSGSKDVSLTFTIPDGITTSHLYQVYRSASFDNTVSDVVPNEELGQVLEGNPTSGEITAKTLTVVDNRADELRGTDLYTNVNSGNGIASANLEPPLCKDIAVFNDTTFFLNTTTKHRYFLTMLGCGGTGGVQLNDTITIDGIVFTAKTVEATSSGQFRLYTTGTFTFVDADVSVVGDTITEPAHGLQNGDAVVLSTSGVLPGGLTAATTYYVVAAATNTFQLALTSGGSAINITSAAGGGTHTVSYGGSASQNIRNTALSLIRCINRYASSTVYATYLSSSEDLPGKILVEERSIGGSAFALTSTRSACWSPALPSSGTTESSTNDIAKNGIYFSKTFQPEAVPLGNTLFAGSKDKAILRGIPLRNKLILLKEDGIYSISQTFEVEEISQTAITIGPETAVVLGEAIYAFTSQGVVKVSDSSGVEVASRQIENTLLELQGLDMDVLRNESFAVSYESERKYFLFVPSAEGDTHPTQCFVYNIFTNSWTRWPITKTCGGVNPVDDKLYLGSGDSAYVNQERKSFSYTDYVDYGFASTITNVSAKTITVGSADLIEVGDLLFQSSSIFAVVSAVDPVAGTVTTATTSLFTNGTVDVLKAIQTKIQWAPISLGNPGILKQFTEAMVLFSSAFYGSASLIFSTDLSPSEETETITGIAVGGFGLFAWGGQPWGGGGKRKPFRVQVPRNKQRATILNVKFQHQVGYARYALNGISIPANPGSSKAVR